MMQFVNRDSFWFGWLLVLLLIALAKTSITVLIKSGERGTLFLFLILEGKLSAFAIEYDDICGFVIYGLSYFEVCLFYPTLRGLLLNYKFMLIFFLLPFFMSIQSTLFSGPNSLVRRSFFLFLSPLVYVLVTFLSYCYLITSCSCFK